MLRSQIAECEMNKVGFVRNAFDRILGGNGDKTVARIAELQCLLAVSLARRSQARCLACSSADTVELSFDEAGNFTNFVHDCGSCLYIVPENPDTPKFSYHAEVVTLDVEGRRK